MTKRKLTAKWFKTKKISRIYEDGRYMYETTDDLRGCTAEDLAYYLRTSQNYYV